MRVGEFPLFWPRYWEKEGLTEPGFLRRWGIIGNLGGKGFRVVGFTFQGFLTELGLKV